MLNQISQHTNIFIPVSAYLLEIMESTHFNKFYKEKNVTSEHSLDINLNLKIKKEEYKNYSMIFFLLEETLDSLLESLAINAHKFSYPEIAFPIVHQLKKISKNMLVYIHI